MSRTAYLHPWRRWAAVVVTWFCYALVAALAVSAGAVVMEKRAELAAAQAECRRAGGTWAVTAEGPFGATRGCVMPARGGAS